MKPNIFRPVFWITPTILSDDARIEPFDEKVYAAVDWFHNMKDGICKASNQTLAELIRPSDPQPRSVQNSLTRLEECGYIRREYKDEAKRNRKSIIPLIVMRLERKGDDTHKSNESSMIDERKGDDRANESAMTRVITVSNKRSKKRVPARSAEDENLIGDVIFLFQEVNPMYKTLFNRPPQREAAWKLLEQFGFDKLKAMIQFLPKSNANRFAPTITTPAQLVTDLGKLMAWGEKQKSVGAGKGRVLIT